MLEAIFQGRRELFKGFAIDQTNYDWKTYPAIHIDFSNCSEKTAGDFRLSTDFCVMERNHKEP